jgi:hypothetical protein
LVNIDLHIAVEEAQQFACGIIVTDPALNG